MALGKHRLAISFVAFALSNLICLTLFLLAEGILKSYLIIGSALVVAMMATILPFFPLAFFWQRWCRGLLWIRLLHQ